jgi:hypothetical protein
VESDSESRLHPTLKFPLCGKSDHRRARTVGISAPEWRRVKYGDKQTLKRVLRIGFKKKKKPQKRNFRPAANSAWGSGPPVNRSVQRPSRTNRVNAQREVSRSSPEHLTLFPRGFSRSTWGSRCAFESLRPLQSLRLLAEDAQLETKRSNEGDPSQREASE